MLLSVTPMARAEGLLVFLPSFSSEFNLMLKALDDKQMAPAGQKEVQGWPYSKWR